MPPSLSTIRYLHRAPSALLGTADEACRFPSVAHAARHSVLLPAHCRLLACCSWCVARSPRRRRCPSSCLSVLPHCGFGGDVSDADCCEWRGPARTPAPSSPRPPATAPAAPASATSRCPAAAQLLPAPAVPFLQPTRIAAARLRRRLGRRTPSIAFLRKTKVSVSDADGHCVGVDVLASAAHVLFVMHDDLGLLVENEAA